MATAGSIGGTGPTRQNPPLRPRPRYRILSESAQRSRLKILTIGKRQLHKIVDTTDPFDADHSSTRGTRYRADSAQSPQAKGRVERCFATAQDRLVKGLRLRRANTLEQANGYLEREFLPKW